MYILIVDPDQFGNKLLKFSLAQEGYEVESTDNAGGAMHMIELREPDLLLVEVTMPYTSGFDFASKLRSNGYETPLIFVTAQGGLDSILHGFNLGADDYVCKPYYHQELVARIQAVLRRAGKSKATVHCIRRGQIELYPGEMKVIIHGRSPILLTPTETQILKILMTAEGQALNRDQLLAGVWHEIESNSNIVDVYVRRLRRKLEEDPIKPQYITSVHGVGYKFSGSEARS